MAMSKVPAQYEKEAYVEGLFSAIAGRYDLMNSVLSLTRHRAWRRFAASRAGLGLGDCALDVCCGTGDFAFELSRIVGKQGRVVGTDFSQPMIELARAKAARRAEQGIEFLTANTCELPFADGTFDCVTVGFGVRNLADIDAGLAEMARVLKPGGRLVCLETGEVRSKLIRLPWKLYFHIFTPYAAAVMGARKWAYEYLPRSAKWFLSREELARRFEKHGLIDVAVSDLMFGAVCVHVGTKKK
jgi:demethylmenaquinone methyltransferase/2-methoxy-6-polyprenyl-1,4-benzoquinol methylase